MYQALYRKYRPSTFSDVYGQPHIVRTLRNQIAEGRLSHAYLFTGSRGTGKTSCAKILAKAVNCLHPKDGDPCNECEICRGINDETIFDITEIDAASNNGVDNIRELRENTAFTPAAAKYRVYIIDEVHMLSGAAFNALLKTLEEPPAHVIFILATTEVHKLPATILSRCQRFDFHRIPPEDISSRLLFVARNEGFSLTDDAAMLIAKLSDGALRDALSLLDVCSADTDTVTEQTVQSAAGLSGSEYLSALSEAVADGSVAAALEIIDRLYGMSKDLSRLCSELIGHYRDLMLIKSMRNPEKLITCPSGEIEHMRELSARMTLETILHAIELFEDAYMRMNRGANRRTALEGAFIRLCDPTLDDSAAAVLRRLSALESGRAIPSGGAARPDEAPKSSPKTAADTPPDVKTGKTENINTQSDINSGSDPQVHASADILTSKVQPPDAQENILSAPERTPLPDEPPAVPEFQEPPLPDNNPERGDLPEHEAPEPPCGEVEFDGWPDVLANLNESDKLLWAALGGSRAYISGNRLLLDFQNDSFRDLINSDMRHKQNLKTAIVKAAGREYGIGPYTGRKSAAPAADDPLDNIIKIAKEKGL